ncbi:hypothetical protein [Clostridium celatum]|uniref:hypothetical protein n=1 Tax=Clostridium celatum TaxID=36834 RepID=UPI001898410E|nr:hypothetical protein [Clostridium celatum]
MELKKREEAISILEEIFADISKSKVMINRYLETGNFNLLFIVNDFVYEIYDKYSKENMLITSSIIGALNTLCYLISNILGDEFEEMNNLDEEFKCRYYLAFVNIVCNMILDEIYSLNNE